MPIYVTPPINLRGYQSGTQAPFPYHFLPGGQMKFVVSLILIVLVWWGWYALKQEDDE